MLGELTAGKAHLGGRPWLAQCACPTDFNCHHSRSWCCNACPVPLVSPVCHQAGPSTSPEENLTGLAQASPRAATFRPPHSYLIRVCERPELHEWALAILFGSSHSSDSSALHLSGDTARAEQRPLHLHSCHSSGGQSAKKMGK